MLGAGLYAAFAKQYGKTDAKIASLLIKTSKDEYMQ
jgi:hypothetical protein